jgi:hypothetical protein
LQFAISFFEILVGRAKSLRQRRIGIGQLPELEVASFQGGLGVGNLPPLRVELEENAHLGTEDGRIDRFEEEVHRARAIAAQYVVLAVPSGRQEDDGNVASGRVLACVVSDFVPVHFRHLHVEQKNGELPLEELAQGFVAALGNHHLASQAIEQRAQGDQVGLDVVDDENRNARRFNRVRRQGAGNG